MKEPIIVVCSVITVLLIAISAWGLYFVNIPQRANEIGDAIAGFSSSLAFIWIVGGMMMQTKYANLNAQNVAKEICINGAQTIIKSLDYAIDCFEPVFIIAMGKLGQEADIAKVTRERRYGAIRYLVEKETPIVEAITEHTDYVHLKKNLRRETLRYKEKYTHLLAFLSEETHGDWVLKSLVKDSMYEDMYVDLTRKTSSPTLADLFDLETK